jgi:hypothetical protein
MTAAISTQAKSKYKWGMISGGYLLDLKIAKIFFML